MFKSSLMFTILFFRTQKEGNYDIVTGTRYIGNGGGLRMGLDEEVN